MNRFRRTVAGLAWALVLPMSIAIVLDVLYGWVLVPRGLQLSDQVSTLVTLASSTLLMGVMIFLGALALRGRLPGTHVPQPAGPSVTPESSTRTSREP